ncbi:MAG: DNA-deoxyinosine glycosylase [Collinsella sp.]|nr:DNA-deoxyinosine glycosylase [Collinsella sp.]
MEPAARVTHTIDPVFNEKSRILILGTMPSPRSREEGFFYGHPQNRFWRVMERIFALPPASLVDCDARIGFLLDRRIALWDVLASCRIEGASDASISDPIPNDLSPILDAATIELVCTTGGKAAALCKRFHRRELARRGIELSHLPSTSPANARMSLDDLVVAYERALAPLLAPHKETVAVVERSGRGAGATGGA